jgi:hypothetical protein
VLNNSVVLALSYMMRKQHRYKQQVQVATTVTASSSDSLIQTAVIAKLIEIQAAVATVTQLIDSISND